MSKFKLISVHSHGYYMAYEEEILQLILLNTAEYI